MASSKICSSCRHFLKQLGLPETQKDVKNTKRATTTKVIL